jgi:arylsulfatase A-like enzyme/uncharacterized membrane protein YbhN (UPF0104 family)
MKKAIFFGIKAAFIVFVFVALLNPDALPLPESIASKLPGNLSFSGLMDTLSNLNMKTALFWFSFAAIVKILGIFSGVLRWHFLLLGQGIRLPFWYLTKCWFMGRAIGLLLPGTVGLDGYRLVESSAYTGEVIKCTTVIAVEKLIGIVALGLLVFLTLPLGARLFDFNYVMLGMVLFILLSFITTAFLLLLNPRIVQVLVTVIPTPEVIRSKVHKLGVAVTAYSGHRFNLLIAVVLGLGVHLGICLMYFGVAMGISDGASSLLDILFASPLVIVASVIAPTVSGLGVREGVMTVLLGGTYGESESFLFGHLGLWIGEAIPFILSIPLLLFATRPNRDKFLADLAEVRAESGEDSDVGLHLTPEEIHSYRSKIVDCLGAGLFAGLIGGALLGLAEGFWHMHTLNQFGETFALWWAPLVYGLVLCGAGLGISVVLVFGYLLVNKFVPAAISFGLSLGGTMGAVLLVFGRFRYRRDILGEQALSLLDNLYVLGATLIVVALAVVVGSLLAGWVKNRFAGVGAGLACYLGIVAIGVAASFIIRPNVAAIAFDPEEHASGPPVILIAVDTLRADYLKAYNYSAGPETPNISALADDSVLFQHTFAQSSWTKASFGTIFSGMYPEAHTATGKASALPDEVTTIAETLQTAGYYTKGFSNNPNITSIFNYNQGFVDYTDLKPDLYFGARPSCEKLVLYDILRKVVQVVNAKRGGRIAITDFYQPGEVVTDRGLAWLDGPERPADTPFHLFLHYMDPHDPFRDPDRPGKGYARVQMGNPDPEKYRDAFIRSYTYEIEYMDGEVGRFLQGLKDRGIYDDALIIFTADHGEEFHEHGGWWHGLSLYDEQIAIPLMFKLPHSEIADVNNDLARHVDIAPTIAELLDLPKAEQWQGSPLLTRGLQFGNADTEYVHSHLDFEGIRLHALRTMNKKLIEANKGNKRGYAPIELYDLDADPGEQTNVADESPAEVEVFQKTLQDMESYIKENAAEPMQLNLDDMSDEEKAQLEALGYLGGEGEEEEEGDEEFDEEDLPDL